MFLVRKFFRRDPNANVLSEASASSASPPHHRTSRHTLHELPHEVLIHVLARLSPVELSRSIGQCNRALNRISRDPRLWKNLELTRSKHAQRLQPIIGSGCCTQLQSLHLSDCEGVTDGLVCAFALRCRQLRSVALRQCDNITDLSPQHLAVCCLQLTSLDLTGCDRVTDHVLPSIFQLPRLQSLNLSSCSCITLRLAENQCPPLPSLTALKLDGCASVSEDALGEIFINAPRLKILELDGEDLSDAIGESLSTVNTLEDLHIGCCGSLSDGFLNYLGSMSQMRALRLRDGAEFTSVGFCSLFSGSPQHQPQPQHQQPHPQPQPPPLAGPHPGTQADFDDLALAFEAGVAPAFAYSSTAAVAAVPPPALPNTSVATAAAFAIGAQLRLLDLSRCDDVCDHVCAALAAACPLLEELHLNWCYQVSDAGVTTVLRSCSGLLTLYLCGVVRLTQTPLELIPTVAPRLCGLSVEECGLISMDAIHKLQGAMPHLTVVDFFGTTHPRLGSRAQQSSDHLFSCTS